MVVVAVLLVVWSSSIIVVLITSSKSMKDYRQVYYWRGWMPMRLVITG